MTALRLGDWVLSVREISEVLGDGTKHFHAAAGSIGHVIDLRKGYLPTIFWESTATVYDAIQGAEFEFLCRADFARTPETTPGGGTI